MEASTLKTRTNPAQEAFDKAQAAIAAQRARRTRQSDVRTKKEPADQINFISGRARFATSR